MAETAAERFFNKVFEILKKIVETQKETIQTAANMITDAIVNDGMVYVFGTGHSHLIAEEAFARAGGLACFGAILDPSFMLHTGAFKSSMLEKLSGYAAILLNYYFITGKDVLIIVSNSGINAVPVEMAIEGKKRGAKIIAITSIEHSKNMKSRHPSGKKLYELADVVIDNCGILGDAILDIEGVKYKVAPTSTITAATILNALVAQVAENLRKRGIDPPIWVSGNVEGSELHNLQLALKYKDKLRHL